VALGVNAGPPQAVERCVCDLHAMRPSHPLAQGRRGGEPRGPVAGVFQAGEPLRRERDGWARGDVGRQPRVQPPGGITCQPAAHRVAMDPQPARHVLARVGWPTGQQVPHLQARRFVAVMCMWPALLARGARFVNRRHGVAQR
jgi:hypothetical protein